MNRIKEVLEEQGIKQIWLAEQLQYSKLLRSEQKTTKFGNAV